MSGYVTDSSGELFTQCFCFFMVWHFRILVPQPGIETAPPAMEAQSLNHWTAREEPGELFENTPRPTSWGILT